MLFSHLALGTLTVKTLPPGGRLKESPLGDENRQLRINRHLRKAPNMEDGNKSKYMPCEKQLGENRNYAIQKIYMLSYLYEVSTTDKYSETESRLVIA